MARAREGDIEAWARLYHEHFEALFRHIGFMTGDPSLSEDLTQEVFARAYVALARFNGRSQFSTWLYGIACNVVRDHWRKQGRQRRAYARLLRAEPETTATVEEEQQLHEQARALASALESLPAHYREAFTLVSLQELPTAEVAEILGISVSNVSVRVHRARKRIVAFLETHGWLGEPGGTRS